MVDDRACPKCGKKIKYVESAHARGHNKYCSRECYELSRSALLAEARRQGKSLRQLIVDLLNEYKKPTVAAEIMGTSQCNILYWMRKFGIRNVWV